MTRSSKKYAFIRPQRKRIHPTHGSDLLTKQSFKDECDVNNIIAKFEATGYITSINNKEPVFGDASSSMSFKEALDFVNTAKIEFANLSDEHRSLFQNDFNVYCQFLEQKDSIDFDAYVDAESSTGGALATMENAKGQPSAESSKTDSAG